MMSEEEQKALESLEKAPLEVATITIHCNVRTGKIDVGGHLDNLHLNMQMLLVAGNVLIERAAQIRKAAEEDAKKAPGLVH